jgi:2-dehydro-3-deoxyphosphogluconate aldolase / (4S)-4-hydroxy-2-oxoglutarate aldolase
MTDTGLPHLAGVATVSQILSALEAEYTELK